MPLTRDFKATVQARIARDGAHQTFAFCAKGEYLESEHDIPEPHEFKAIVQVSHGRVYSGHPCVRNTVLPVSGRTQ